MRLPEHVVESLKSTLAHNTAQKRLQDKQLGIQYLNQVKELFTEMKIDEEQSQTLLTYARLKSIVEVKTLKGMFERYGFNPTISGHGGSEMSIKTIIEIAIARGE